MPEVQATAAPIEDTPAVDAVAKPEVATAEALTATVDAPTAPVAVETVAVADPESAVEVAVPVAEAAPVDPSPPELAPAPAEPPVSSPAPAVPESLETLSEGTPTIAELAGHPVMATTAPPASASEAEIATPGVIATPAEIIGAVDTADEQSAGNVTAPLSLATEGEPVAVAIPDERPVEPEPARAEEALPAVAEGGDGGSADPVDEPAAAPEQPAEPVAAGSDPAARVESGVGTDAVAVAELAAAEDGDANPEPVHSDVPVTETLPAEAIPVEEPVKEDAEAAAPAEVVDAPASAPVGDQPSPEPEADAQLPEATADAAPINTDSVPPASETPGETPAEQPSALEKVADDLATNYGLEKASWLVALKFAAKSLNAEGDVLAAIKQDNADGREKMSRACRRATNEAFPDFPNDERVSIARELAAILKEMADKADSDHVQAAIAEALS